MKTFFIALLLMPIGIYAQTGGTWTATALTNAPKARTESKAVWTGTKMIVWGGKDSSGYLKSGAIYDPATNKWKTMATAPLLGRSSHAMLWTGTELIVWGGRGRYGTPQKNRLLHDGARYNPNTDTWTSIYIYDVWGLKPKVIKRENKKSAKNAQPHYVSADFATLQRQNEPST